MKSGLLLLLILIVALVALPACGADTDAAAPDGPASTALEGTSWTLARMNGSVVMDGTTLTLSFSDGNVSGSGGCNTFGGGYRLVGNAISFGEMASTLMACDDGVMNQEQNYLAILQMMNSERIENGQLIMEGPAGSSLIFDPAR